MFKKAERKKAKLRLALSGTSGSGKTYGSLLIAQGLGGKIAMIDTENGSGELYAHIADYDVLTLQAPFEVEKYVKAIKAAEAAGYDVLIIDSLSHAWNGSGGLLELQSKLTETKYKGNSYAAWKDITPLQEKLTQAILQSNLHVIATMRSKTEYMQTDDNGKKTIKKVGLAPVQRDGLEYEFTVMLDIDQETHYASASKDRTGLFDNKINKITPAVGEQLAEWLNGGSEPVISSAQAKKLVSAAGGNVELVKSIIGKYGYSGSKDVLAKDFTDIFAAIEVAVIDQQSAVDSGDTFRDGN